MVESSLDALRTAQEQALARLGQAWKSFSEALSSVQSAGTWDPGKRLGQFVDAWSDVASAVAEPLVRAQHDQADRLEQWAALQRQTADLMGEWAVQQRAVADLLDKILRPLGPMTDKRS
jgi:hypothetical protein